MSTEIPKHLHVSPLIFKYVLREFTIPLICALAAFAFLFLVNNVFDDLPDFMSKNVPMRVVLGYFLSLQPHNLLNVIPISVLLAASFMTVMLGRSNELCAMRAAGMSLFTCALPVWILALVASICTICIGEFWGPAGLQNAARIRREWLDSKKQAVESLAFRNLQENRDWYCQDLDLADVMHHVIVRQYNEEGETQWMLIAETAKFRDDGICVFKNGSRQKVGAGGENLLMPPEIFETYELNCKERLKDIAEQGHLQDSVTTREALSILRSEITPSPQVARHLRTAVWNNLTFPLASLVGALFGVALTIANQRSEIMKGFAGAIGVLVLFYIVAQVFMVFGKNGWLPPFIAGGFPALVFTFIGFAVMWRKQ
ncbi:MAG: LptF/LptG family permease [Lentisphaeria bacterium]|nr:LptF/LptG family permease [Lentisphaeria bacterium]